MARFDDLLPDARSGLTQVPDAILLRALRRGAMELCRQSHIWRESLDAIAAEDGVHTYELGAPSGTRVERIVVMTFNGRAMQQARPQDLVALDSASGTPRCFAQMPVTQEFRLHPTPDASAAGKSIEAFVALSPLANATTIPDDLLREYALGIISLGKAWLMGTSPGMPWHDLRQAAVQQAIGDEWVLRAKRDQHGGGHTPLTMKLRPFV